MNNRKKIIIIDDERDLSLLLKAFFLRKQYSVSVAHSFPEALTLVKEFQPDIVFLKSAVCQNPAEDMKALKQEVPNAEIVLNYFTITH